MIFCFSATGNSLHVANSIASATNDKVTMIKDVIDGDCKFEDDVIGIVCPVHFYGLPIMVYNFIKKMNVQCKYSFLILTFGTFTGNALSEGRRLMMAKGMDVSYSATIRMPENYIILLKAPDDKKERKILDDAEEMIRVAIESIKFQNCAQHDNLCGPRLVYPRVMHAIFLKARRTEKFHTNGKCNGCGSCAKLCPIHAIEIRDNGPVWVKDRCLKCLACINRCPNQAIEYGSFTKSKKRYVHRTDD